jgi:hypothetical protein
MPRMAATHLPKSESDIACLKRSSMLPDHPTGREFDEIAK